MSGANILDVASNSVNVGILQAFGGNVTQGQDLISDAYKRAHDELKVQEGLKADGIRADGSFNQVCRAWYYRRVFYLKWVVVAQRYSV